MRPLTARRRGVSPAVFLATAAALWGTTVSAAERTLKIDPAATRVTFELDAGLHTIHGTGKLTEGAIVFDDATGRASGRVVVDARTLESGNGSRDKTMHNDILESAQYPDIVLLPEGLQGEVPADGEGDVTLTGTFEIHGGSHLVSLPAHVKVSPGRLEGTARLDVPFVEWGMKDPSFFVLRVKKTVQITLVIAGRLGSDAEPPPVK